MSFITSRRGEEGRGEGGCKLVKMKASICEVSRNYTHFISKETVAKPLSSWSLASL